MLRGMLDSSEMQAPTFLRDSAMAAVNQIYDWGDISRLNILFSHDELGCELQNVELFRLMINKWHGNSRDLTHAFGLVDQALAKLIHEQWENNLLRIAARTGCMPIIERLITNARHNTALTNELRREYRSSQTGYLTH